MLIEARKDWRRICILSNKGLKTGGRTSRTFFFGSSFYSIRLFAVLNPRTQNHFSEGMPPRLLKIVELETVENSRLTAC